MKVLIVGPSPTRSKGGMATVIEEIEKDKILNYQFLVIIKYMALVWDVFLNILMCIFID